MITKLRTIQPSDKNKTMKQYEKLINKYQQIEPLNVRMKATTTKNIENKVVVKKTNAANKIQKLFKSFYTSKYAATYLVDVLLFSAKPAHPKQKPYKGVYLMAEQQNEVRAPNPFPQDINKQLIRVDQQKTAFKKGMNIFFNDRQTLQTLD